jgi:hypothetical protein
MGRASGSARAAAVTSSSVIARSRSQSVLSSRSFVDPSGKTWTTVPSLRRLATIIFSSLMICCSSRGDYANSAATFCINNCQKPISSDSCDHISELAGFVCGIRSVPGKQVLENSCRRLKADAVFRNVCFSLGCVPFKLFCVHDIRADRSMSSRFQGGLTRPGRHFHREPSASLPCIRMPSGIPACWQQSR